MPGTAFYMIDQNLKCFKAYLEFRDGDISATSYQNWIEMEGRANVTALNEDQINLSARFPAETHAFVRRALSQCKAHDIIINDRYDEEAVQLATNKIAAQFDHNNYLTYIFPEEFMFLFAVAQSTRPVQAAFMGSYYGYWAMAARLASADLNISLMDINATVMAVAERNFYHLGASTKTHFMIGDAEKSVTALESIDLLVLDAEGPKSEDVAPDYRDKAIYYPHLKAALSRLAPGALLVAHNVILSNHTAASYFEAKQRSYRQQYKKFLALVREHFIYTIIDSTEGILIGRKR